MRNTVIVACRTLCPLIALWGISGFGIPSLIDILKEQWHLSTTTSAAGVSLVVALSGTLACFPRKTPPLPSMAERIRKLDGQ